MHYSDGNWELGTATSPVQCSMHAARCTYASSLDLKIDLNANLQSPKSRVVGNIYPIYPANNNDRRGMNGTLALGALLGLLASTLVASRQTFPGRSQRD